MKRALLLIALLGGCRTATSVLVRVSATGLAIPEDVASVRITADDPDDPGAGNIYQSADLPLCANGSQSGCYTLPITVAMRPGEKMPDATVRVTVTASDAGGNLVTSDVARFSFTDGDAATLDFVLTARCLHTNCAIQDRACGATGGCEGLLPSSGGPPDLAMPPAPMGPIARVYEKDQNFTTSGQVVLQPPPNTQPGDLVLLFAQEATPSAGWSTFFAGDYLLLVRRTDADEATATATYTFGVNAELRYVMLIYRNVERYQLGLLSGGAPPFVYPSFDAVGGAYSIQLVSDGAGCYVDVNGGPPIILTSGGNFDEWGPLPAGPTGQRTLVCPSATDSTAQVLLFP